MRLAYSVVICIVSVHLFQCNEVKVETKPFLEHRLVFYAYDKSCFNSFDSNISVDDLKELLSEISSYEFDSAGEYSDYFSRYSQSIDLKEHVKTQLKELKNKLEIDLSSQTKNKAPDSFSYYRNFLLYKNCGVFFRKDWVALPEIKFSDLFYNNISEEGQELLFKHYEYENANESDTLYFKYSLPICKLLATEDIFTIQPHEIAKEKAIFLLNELDTKEPFNGSIINEEVIFFKRMLQGVINDQYLVVIYNYSAP